MEGVDLIRTDKDRILNLQQVRWFSHHEYCFEVCTKSGCGPFGTHKVCKDKSPTGYARLEEMAKSVPR
jgi:hypothetical protein